MKWFFSKLPELTSSEEKEYLFLCDRVAEILTTAGVPRRGYLEPATHRLRSHPHPHRVIENLRVYLSVLESALEHGESLQDDKRLLWRMIQRLGLRPCADMMDHVEDEDTIQVYTTDNWLIYQNLKFFDYVDATVDEISTVIWSRDSRRKASIAWEALRLVFLMKTKTLRSTFRVTSVPRHEVLFQFSGKLQKVSLDIKTVSPLMQNRRVVGYVVIQKTERLPLGPHDHLSF